MKPATGGRPSVSTPGGLAALNEALAATSYVAGFRATAVDAAVYDFTVAALGARGAVAPDATVHPHLARWFRHMGSFTAAQRKAFPAGGALTFSA